MIKISIITATWNSAETLPATLESIASQTYSNFELIIVDGGSTDNTMDIVHSSSIVSRWVSEPDKGIYDALNKGIAMAQGEYISFMHSDDIYAARNSLELVCKMLESDPDAIYADLQYVSKLDTDIVVRHWKSGEFNFNKLKWGWMPPHPTFIMKRVLYKKFGCFDLSYKIAADYDSVVRYLYVNKVKPSYLPEVIVKMRVGGASNRSLANILQKSKEDFLVMRSAGIFFLVGMLGKNLSKIPQFMRLM